MRPVEDQQGAAGVSIDASAKIDPDARIFPSSRGTRIVIGARTWLDAFVVVRCVGGMGDIVIGDDCFVNAHSVLYSGNGITMGNHVLLAPHVSIVPSNHAYARRDVPMAHQRFMPSRGGTTIEDDVWIGANAVLLDGAYIERGAVIGAGSVVSGRVGAFSIWAGVPARRVRDRP